MKLVGFHGKLTLATDFVSKNIEKIIFSKKTKNSAIRAVIIIMQTKYNDPESNLVLQTFVHKMVIFYFLDVMIFDDFSYFPDSFWWISMDLSTN